MICKRLEVCLNEELSGINTKSCKNNASMCIESSDRRSEVKCEEKRKKYILQNSMKNHVISYRMDGGIIVLDATVPEGTSKCDYLFVDNAGEPIAILIELKGVDVAKAIKQIKGTLDIFKDFFKSFAHVYGRAVVTSSTPNLKASPDYVNLVNLLKKTYNGNVKIVNQQFIEKDVDLDKE